VNHSPRLLADLALVSHNTGMHGDGGNRTHATFPPSPPPSRKRGRRRHWYDFQRERELTRFAEWTERGPIPGSEPTEPYSDSRGWKLLLKRDPCAYCGGKGGTVDHIAPKWRGRKPKPLQRWLNYTGSCPQCNERKGTLSLLFFLLAESAPVKQGASA
jgi:hypothetical protein